MPDTSALGVYAGVFAALVAAGVGFPIPEELPVVTAGALVGRAAGDPSSPLRWWVLLPVCVLGVVLSDLMLYAVGRVGGVRVLRLGPVARVLPPGRLDRLRERFHRHGVWILLAARLVPGLRSPVFLAAGILRLPWRRFLIADGLYALPGVALMFFLAYWLTDTFRDWVLAAEGQAGRAKLALAAAAAVACAVYLLTRWLRKS